MKIFYIFQILRALQQFLKNCLLLSVSVGYLQNLWKIIETAWISQYKCSVLSVIQTGTYSNNPFKYMILVYLIWNFGTTAINTDKTQERQRGSLIWQTESPANNIQTLALQLLQTTNLYRQQVVGLKPGTLRTRNMHLKPLL